MTVSELLSRISSRELSEWLAYFRIEGPPGEGRADWRAGMVAATIANVNRDPKKRRKPFEPADFLPQWSASDAGASWRDQLRAAEAINRALGGRDLRS